MRKVWRGISSEIHVTRNGKENNTKTKNDKLEYPFTVLVHEAVHSITSAKFDQ